MKDLYQILRHPHITEKSVALKNEAGYIAFRVHKSANKKQVARAVEKIFDVKVDFVRIINVPSKKRRMGRYEGHKPGYKKALVKIKQGEKMIEYFDNL